MSLHEALERLYNGSFEAGLSVEYLLLRQAVRQLTPEQVKEIEALTQEP